MALHPPTATTRQDDSDSDSNYGARSKKKKKTRAPGEELRVSSRGVKVPNHVDGLQDFEREDEDAEGLMYATAAAPVQEEDEIEYVLNHSRAEGHEDDPEDDWQTNVVCVLLALRHKVDYTLAIVALPHQVEELLTFTQH